MSDSAGEPFNANTPLSRDVDVVIAGAGPVGLLLANLLGKQGRSVMVLERRTVPAKGSMAIGITPPSLDILHELGLGEVFTKRGVPIETARVFEHGEALGQVDFSRLPTEHRFILSLPQSMTLEILRNRLRCYPTVTLVDGTEVVAQAPVADAVHVTLRDVCSGAVRVVKASFLAGCDGAKSAVRHHAGIGSRAHAYGCHFVMADFEDQTGLGDEAHLYFGPDGSVESFPLPGDRRRWIALRTAKGGDSLAFATQVVRCVQQRVGVDLSAAAVHFESEFQPAYALAARYVQGRVVLCGDAAHVMSPIGGQGMNTGFSDAAHLARALNEVLDGSPRSFAALRHYALVRRRAFRIAARRAECGMWLGTRRGRACSLLRRFLIVRILFRPSVRARLAIYFAMLTIPQEGGIAARVTGPGGVFR